MLRDLLRPAIRDTPPYVPGEQPAPGRRVIKLNTNENPYPPSPRVIEALQQASDAGVRLYPDPIATGLRNKAAAVYGVPADHIMAGNGSDELLALLLRACVDPGERVATPVPTYSLYETLVAVQGGTLVRVPFPESFALPVEALIAAKARVTFVCNPNAPSGTRTSVDTIEAMAREVPGVVVVDEAYVDFADDHALRLVGRVSNVVVLRTFSKSFSLAGLRIGLAFGHPELLAGLHVVRDSYNVNCLTQAAAIAALDDVPHMQANVARIRATRDALTASLVRLRFEVLPSEANFVLARRRGQDMQSVMRALAARDVFVRHFPTPDLCDALRITVGTDAEVGALIAALSAVLAED